MKRFLLSLITLSLTIFAAPNVGAATTNNFYFENAEFDYYLEKTDSGSKMHVKEVLTAVFPETNQNHGITRSIPYSNQSGKNLTAASISALGLTVLRNGAAEKVSKTETGNGVYTFYIGDSSTYVHGTQVYTLEYDFTNVITEFDISKNMTWNGENADFQELYWDTNGTGWSQRFNSLTARLHLPADITKNLRSGTSCYVGAYGFSGSSRCTISSDDETTYNSAAKNATAGRGAEAVLTFTATNLSAGENLTFAVDFEKNTFTVPAPQKSYLAMIIFIVTTGVIAVLILLMVSAYKKSVGNKANLAKKTFVKPEYQPPVGLTVAESAIISLNINKSSFTATVLELAIARKIQLKKSEEKGFLGNVKDGWEIIVKDLSGLTPSQENVLAILNGGSIPAAGETFKVENHRATASLERLSKEYTEHARKSLKAAGYIEEKTQGAWLWVFPVLAIAALAAYFGLAFNLFSPDMAFGGLLFPELTLALLSGFVVFSCMLSGRAVKYSSRTEEGIKMSVYLDGLRLYIKMAEKERLAFLQSVKGADTSDTGIVKLYEKLLPYACLFGLEESWMNELNKYYERAKNYDHDWYYGHNMMSYAMLHSLTTTTSSTITHSTSYSSSSSGGGGGGFSGGGGGGGGGGGW